MYSLTHTWCHLLADYRYWSALERESMESANCCGMILSNIIWESWGWGLGGERFLTVGSYYGSSSCSANRTEAGRETAL